MLAHGSSPPRAVRLAVLAIVLLVGGCAAPPGPSSARSSAAGASTRATSFPKAGATLGFTGSAGDGPTVAAAAACRVDVLTIGPGPAVSPQTGEHSLIVSLTNRARVVCRLAGFPTVSLLKGTEVLPFRYVDGRSSYFSSGGAGEVVLAPRRAAYVKIAKYRCDVGDLRVATTVRLGLGAGGPSLSLALSGSYPDLAYCEGGRQDPGQTVAVSTFAARPFF